MPEDEINNLETDIPDESLGTTPEETPTEIELLRNSFRALEEQNAQILDQFQRMAAPPQQQVQPQIPTQFDWNNPDGAIDKRVQEIAAPYIQQTAASIANMQADSFRASKMGDPLFGPVSIVFDREMAKLNKVWLGSLPPDVLRQTLQTAWNASVGEYVEAERKKTPKVPTGNISSGGTSSGATPTGGHKTFAELDPEAYALGKKFGLTDEELQEIAEGNS